MRHLKFIPLVYQSSPLIDSSTPKNFFYEGTYYLEPAEFTDFTDSFGMFEENIEPENFFIDIDARAQNYIQDSDKFYGLPEARLYFHLSDKKHVYERQKYSILMLMSDFGGF